MARAKRHYLPGFVWHLTHRCICYIDLNRVRCGIVKHPGQWYHSGYNEIQRPPQRYGLIDFKSLMGVLQLREEQAGYGVRYDSDTANTFLWNTAP